MGLPPVAAALLKTCGGFVTKSGASDLCEFCLGNLLVTVSVQSREEVLHGLAGEAAVLSGGVPGVIHELRAALIRGLLTANNGHEGGNSDEVLHDEEYRNNSSTA